MSERDLKASVTRRSWPTRDCCAMGGEGVASLGMMHPTGHVIKRLQSGHIKTKLIFFKRYIFIFMSLFVLMII